MNRREITSRLGEMVKRRLSRSCALWAPEVVVPAGREGVRFGCVDFAGFSPYWDMPDASSLERGILECYEIKSCLDDFKSGNGLNFVGDVNWLVCPQDLCDRLRESQMLPSKAGVLCPDASWSRLLVKIENPAGSYLDIRRSMTAAEAIWRIVKASYGARLEVNSNLSEMRLESEVSHDDER